MGDYPQMLAPVDHVEPVPRRSGLSSPNHTILDTTRAIYVWEWPYYPQYYIPIADANLDLLVDEQHPQRLHRGSAHLYGLQADGTTRPSAARLYGHDAIDGLAGTVRFEWDALDAWFEEDEQVFVHPRNPYVRVDALRSTRTSASSSTGHSWPIGITGHGLRDRAPNPVLPQPHRSELRQPPAPETVTSCPYKGQTTGYWTVLWRHHLPGPGLGL